MNELTYADERIQEALAHHCERLTDDGLDIEERELSVKAVKELGSVYATRIRDDNDARAAELKHEAETTATWTDIAVEAGKVVLGVCQVLGTIGMFRHSIAVDNRRFDILMDYQTDGGVLHKVSGAKTEVPSAEGKVKAFRFFK